jgi:hypothetical protein
MQSLEQELETATKVAEQRYKMIAQHQAVAHTAKSLEKLRVR